MKTAYSTKPSLKCIPEREKPKPTMTPAEYARAENVRRGLPAKPSYTRNPVTGRDPNSLYAQVFRIVRDKGPILVADIVEIVGVTSRQVYSTVNKAKELAQREGFDWHVEDVRFPGGKTKRRYWVTERAAE